MTDKRNDIWTKIGGLWKTRKEGGRVIASGRVDIATPIVLHPGTSFVILRVEDKRENGPSSELFLVAPRPTREAQSNGAPVGDDDIPF